MGMALDGMANHDTGPGTAIASEARPRRRDAEYYQQLANDDRGTGGLSTADFLGYFSLGLGLAELVAPQAMSRLIGVKHPDARNRGTMRLMGLREISSGLAILSSQKPATAVWSRVAGDAIDLAFLGKTFANGENDRGRTLFATANVLAVAALDLMAAKELSSQPETRNTELAAQGIIRTKRSVTLGVAPNQAYAYWRKLSNLPRFMRHLESVRELDARRSIWRAKAPAGKTVEWEAIITSDVPNDTIAWESTENADVGNRGEVRFNEAPGGRGTEVRVTLEYDPPFGKLGSKIAMLWREEPGQQVMDSLRALKQIMETGEVLLSDSTKERGPHPAHP